MEQDKGVLCHLTSLPSGTLADAPPFMDILRRHGYNHWQMLPITPPDEYRSPYSSSSAFAGWTDLAPSLDGTGKHSPEDGYWLRDWALYERIKEEQGGLPWFEWPEPLRDRWPEALAGVAVDFQSQLDFNQVWQKFRARAEEIQLIGDLPIFIAHDSADVWAHRDLFLLDDQGMPEVVAGVPPDYFSEDGQIWGSVLYDWQAHRKEGWRWWRERIARMLRLFDTVRVDHFRGFHSAWAIPAGAETAREGRWIEGPADELLEILIEEADGAGRIIAEDLGIIPPEVVELRRRYGIRGMAVLQFGFDGDPDSNPHHPSTIKEDQVVYTGTHDNDTAEGWSSEGVPAGLEDMMYEGETTAKALQRLAAESASRLSIVPLQDLLSLGSEARMNTPGTAAGNWHWRTSWEELDEGLPGPT